MLDYNRRNEVVGVEMLNLYTCLFAVKGTDFRRILRSGADEEEIISTIHRIWTARDDRYSEIRSEATVDLPKIEMRYIGG